MRRFAPIAALLAALLIATPALASNDPGFAQQWGMQKIKAEEAWSTSAGVGIVIAVVDTGVDLAHEDLQKLVPGWDFVANDSHPQDDKGPQDGDCNGNFGHGTHVAGIAAAAANNGRGVAGAAPAAKIMPIRVLNQHGCGTVEDIEEGMKWAVDHGAHVVNLSLGEDVVIRNLLGPALGNAIEDAWSRGAVVVIAGGNDAVFPSGYGGLNDTNAIVVNSTNQSDGRSTFSNLSDATWAITAPGTSILSSVPGGYGTASGTSMATPHVAGAAAVLRCAGLNKEQTRSRLMETADDLGVGGKDLEYGHGRLNLAKAVQGLSAPSCKVGGLGIAPSGGGGGSSGGSSGSSRRSGGSRAASSPAAPAPAQPAQEASPAPSPTESVRAETLGTESDVDGGGGNLLLNLALIFLVLVSGIALYVWNYWRASRSPS